MNFVKEHDIITVSLVFLPEIRNIWIIYYLTQETMLGWEVNSWPIHLTIVSWCDNNEQYEQHNQ